jgi:F0F1-type ATP synthase membrane subunit c/vacuolar-type H+-ATPase subunit K
MVDSLISAASVIAAAIAVGFAGLGPGIGQEMLLVKLLKVLLVQKLKEKPWFSFIIFSVHGIFNYLWFSSCPFIIIRKPICRW